MLFDCVLCLMFSYDILIQCLITKYIKNYRWKTFAVGLTILKHQFWDSGTGNHCRQRTNWCFFHSQPNWWLTHTHHAIRISLLAVCTRIYCDFGVKGTEKSFRKMTREFQKSCMSLYKTMETRAHWVTVWTSSSFHCSLPIPSHLSVSDSQVPWELSSW